MIEDDKCCEEKILRVGAFRNGGALGGSSKNAKLNLAQGMVISTQ